jgi:hypothetical protein
MTCLCWALYQLKMLLEAPSSTPEPFYHGSINFLLFGDLLKTRLLCVIFVLFMVVLIFCCLEICSKQGFCV